MRIAISGLSGCGNTSVAQLVGASLGYPVYNYTFRDLACDLGVEFKQIAGSARASIFDLLVVVATLRATQALDIVIGNRLAIWVSRADLNIWLDATLATRTQRISEREQKPYGVVLNETAMRDEENRDRFLHIFGIDLHNHECVDATINTEKSNVEEVAAMIVRLARKRRVKRRSAEREKILALLEDKLDLRRAKIMGAEGGFSIKALFHRSRL